MKPRIGIVDTTFSRVNMGQVALDTLAKQEMPVDVTRITVPGVKDLPAPVRRFLDQGCHIVIACGMVGPEEVDKVCGHEASLGLMWIRAQLGKPILEVFIHMDEPFARDSLGNVTRRPQTPEEISAYEKELKVLSVERTREHALNAYWMAHEPGRLVELAGTGQRQGYEDAGPIQ